MNTGMYVAILFGIGPLMAVGALALHRWRKHREDIAAWERAQEVRNRLRTHGVPVVQAPELTDEEIVALIEHADGSEFSDLEFARAVITADRAKRASGVEGRTP